MSDKGAETQDRRLWQRWQALGETSRAAEPDALMLAAYAEGRLSEAEAAPVEAWLAAAPEALSDIVAARSAHRQSPQEVDERIRGKAAALVPGASAMASAEVLPFRPRRLPPLRAAIAWSGMAASILCASLVGFSMGSDAYASLAGTPAGDSASVDALGTPPSLDSYFSDDSGT